MLYTKAVSGNGFISNRLAMAALYLNGDLSLKDSISLILPDGMSKNRRSLVHGYNRLIKDRSEEEIKSYLSVHYPGLIDMVRGEDKISMLHQIFIEDQYKARKYIKDGSVVIDAGAYIGVFSLFASKIARDVTVLAFEPSKRTFETLSSNIYGRESIKAFNIGLGDREGTQTIHISSSSPVMNTMSEERANNKNKEAFDSEESVTVDTIDNQVTRNGLNRVDFIKIDAEGYEAQILEGARETIRRFKPVISMSAYHHKDDVVRLPKLLKSIYPGYSCKLSNKVEMDFICVAK